MPIETAHLKGIVFPPNATTAEHRSGRVILNLPFADWAGYQGGYVATTGESSYHNSEPGQPRKTARRGYQVADCTQLVVQAPVRQPAVGAAASTKCGPGLLG
jgi:hypothetical protein